MRTSLEPTLGIRARFELTELHIVDEAREEQLQNEA